MAKKDEYDPNMAPVQVDQTPLTQKLGNSLANSFNNLNTGQGNSEIESLKSAPGRSAIADAGRAAAEYVTGVTPGQMENAGIEAVSSTPAMNKNVATQNLNNRRGQQRMAADRTGYKQQVMGNEDTMSEFDMANTERREGILADVAQSNAQRAQAHMPIPEGDMEMAMAAQDRVGINEMQGLPGVYKNVDAGRTIYGDSVDAVANPWDQMQNQGVTSYDEFGNVEGSATPVSQSLTPAEEQYWQENGSFAGFNMETQMPESSMGGGINYGTPPGRTAGGSREDQWNIAGRPQGQGGNWWDKANNPQSYFQDAESIMKRMPYGSPGDRAKRQSMMKHAESLVDIGNSVVANRNKDQRTGIMGNEMGLRGEMLGFDMAEAGRDQFNKDRQYGIEAYQAGQNPVGTFKRGPAITKYNPELDINEQVEGSIYNTRQQPAAAAPQAGGAKPAIPLEELPDELQNIVRSAQAGDINKEAYHKQVQEFDVRNPNWMDKYNQ